MWKAKYLSDTEEEPGLSSEDEATGLSPHRVVARRLPSAHGGVPMPLSVPEPISSVESTESNRYVLDCIV